MRFDESTELGFIRRIDGNAIPLAPTVRECHTTFAAKSHNGRVQAAGQWVTL